MINTEQKKVEDILDMVMKVAGGDLSVQLDISDDYDYLDALAMGINMVIDDLREKQLTDQENVRIKELNKQLEEAKINAEESERLKTAFIANMSHEIRTPMNGILGFAELLKDPQLDDDKRDNYIEIIKNSGLRMLNIINNIINISKLEANLTTLNISATDVNEQIEYIYTFFKNEAAQKGIQLSVVSTLPSPEAIIQCDIEKLYSILTNLVKNAIKYTEKGLIEIGYNLISDRTPAELEFFVKDTGIGIPENKQTTIFDRFIQADNADRNRVEGTGLGLTITKGYVELLGGKIWVESKTGSGSTFFFAIPYIKVKNNKESLIEKPVEEKKELSGNLTVLLVEDDEASEMLISLMIEPVCGRILIARSGPEAIEVFNDNTGIDLILMDIRLPGMDGYKAVEQIRKYNKDVIIIVQSAFGLVGDREKAIETGCNDYIAKPIFKKDLLALLNKYLGNKLK